MKLLPQNQIQVHVSEDGLVAVGAHEHNGIVWWTRLSNPPDDPSVEHDDPGNNKSLRRKAERAAKRALSLL